MPQSPRNPKDAKEQLRYGRAWLALDTLLRQGKSFSGRERNRCFLNLGGGTFANISSASGLGFSDDGRAVAVVDWDFDGDLDVWTTNRASPRVRYLRNDLPNHNHFVGVQLQGTLSNRDAIGARVELYLGPKGQQKRIKSLRAGDAFLSQSTKWIHFGLGTFDQIDRIVVRWPGGNEETFRGLEVDQFWRIVQGSGQVTSNQRAQLLSSGRPAADSGLASRLHSKPSATRSKAGRIVLLNPVPLPSLQYHPIEHAGDAASLHRGRPLLLGLWATWCAPCLEELTLWTANYEKLTQAGLSVAALCVDQPAGESRQHLVATRRLIERLRIPFDVGTPQEGLVPFLDLTQRTFSFAQRSLPLPCCFLIDAKGRLAVVYTGSVSIEQLIQDTQLLEADSNALLAGAIPYPGKWLERPGSISLRKLVLALYESGRTVAAKSYVRRLIEVHESNSSKSDELPQLYRIQAAMFTDEKLTKEAAIALRNVVRLAPRDHRAHRQLANLAISANDLAEAEEHLAAALQVQPDDASLLETYGRLKQRRGRAREAIGHFRKSLALRRDPDVHFSLATALIATSQSHEAIFHFEESLALRPDWPPAANNLAWLLATHRDDSIRNGGKAVDLATKACTNTNHAVPELLTTLAAALAETGQFERAIEIVDSAIDLARQNEKQKLVATATRQRDEYRHRRPLRQ